MYIKRLSFEDRAAGWKVENIEFEQLSLLVGLSGAGKTRILGAIGSLYNIAKAGFSYNGLKWEIEFLDNKHNSLVWKGEFKFDELRFDERQFPLNISFNFGEKDSDSDSFNFKYETLVLNAEKIAERKEDGNICFKDKETVKLSRSKSIIYLLKEEDEIANVFESIKNTWMIRDNYTAAIPTVTLDDNDPKTLEGIQNASLKIPHKLLLVYNHQKDVFNEIKEKYVDVFPFVEDVKFDSPTYKPNKRNPYNDFLVLQIKEKNNPHWIYDWQLSSGMRKTIFLLASAYLSPENSVFLIDELENSFGLNCLSEVIDDIQSNINSQFIMTSHHPYIINNITPEQWILIKRNGPLIEAEKISDKISVRSHHDKFIQLTNYLQRIEQV